jgi:DNA recombination-dependent growth factor C
MGLLSASASIIRYTVEDKGHDETPILERVRDGLTKHAIPDLPDETAERMIGWVPFESPYFVDFERFPFSYSDLFVFSMRIDKKSVPAKVVQQQLAIAIAKRTAESSEETLSKNEKKDIKDRVFESLMMKMPATPSIFEATWDYEAKRVTFLATQKAAVEEFEELFSKSFGCRLIRLFPFTVAEKTLGLSSPDQERLLELTATSLRA